MCRFWQTLSLLLVLGVATLVPTGCSEESGAQETGAACSDGKDNDGDRQIDCDDADCWPLPICGQPLDGGQDADPSGAPEGGAPQDLGGSEVDTQRPPDHGVEADQGASSYGQPCTYASGLETCADGVTQCVPFSTGKGFCTHSCTGRGTCPDPGARFKTECSYRFSNYDMCAFFCMYGGTTYECPSGLTCTPDEELPDQFAWCWP